MASRAQKLHAAYCEGDLAAIRALLDNPADFPKKMHPFELRMVLGDYPLGYALAWSPLTFIQALLYLGADPNYEVHDGFPSLISTLSVTRSDKYEILELLLQKGTDVHQRGINDWTPLHYAVANKDLKAIEILLKHGADPHLKTNIDDYTSPLEDARFLEFTEAIALFEKA